MGFIFNPEKARQVIAFIYENLGVTEIDVIKVQKLLYLVEREAIRQDAEPIVGGHYVAMKNGPVLSEAYDYMKTDKDWPEPTAEEQNWIASFERVGFILRMLHKQDSDLLTPKEMGTIADVCRQYGAIDKWKLVDFTHKFPEWRQNEVGDSSHPIPLEDILVAVNREADIEKILQSRKEDLYFSSIF